MNTNPLFSVLIANYNNGKYLMDAINSVYAQTYTNWEIILVDDASTDNSKELYKELEKDSRIHIFYNEENKGCGYTKRRCAELANGELCGFLDPDDMLLPQAVDSHVKIQVANDFVSCVFSRYYNCDKDMNIMSELRHLVIKDGTTYFTNMNYMPEHFVSFKKSLYDRTEGIASDIKFGVDQDLYFKMEETGPVYVLNEFTYKYRIHNSNISYVKMEEALYWNLIVRHRTCIRRHLNPSEYPVRDFIYYGKCKLKEGTNTVIKSKTYKLGDFLLKPFRIVRKLLNRN